MKNLSNTELSEYLGDEVCLTIQLPVRIIPRPRGLATLQT